MEEVTYSECEPQLAPKPHTHVTMCENITLIRPKILLSSPITVLVRVETEGLVVSAAYESVNTSPSELLRSQT